jgi:hypothetical protein
MGSWRKEIDLQCATNENRPRMPMHGLLCLERL